MPKRVRHDIDGWLGMVFFCLGEDVLEESFRFRDKLGMTIDIFLGGDLK